MSEPRSEIQPCMERPCWTMAYRLLLGPLRPHASICEHGHAFRLNDMVPPWPAEVQAQAADIGSSKHETTAREGS